MANRINLKIRKKNTASVVKKFILNLILSGCYWVETKVRSVF